MLTLKETTMLKILTILACLLISISVHASEECNKIEYAELKDMDIVSLIIEQNLNSKKIEILTNYMSKVQGYESDKIFKIINNCLIQNTRIFQILKNKK